MWKIKWPRLFALLIVSLTISVVCFGLLGVIYVSMGFVLMLLSLFGLAGVFSFFVFISWGIQYKRDHSIDANPTLLILAKIAGYIPGVTVAGLLVWFAITIPGPWWNIFVYAGVVLGAVAVLWGVMWAAEYLDREEKQNKIDDALDVLDLLNREMDKLKKSGVTNMHIDLTPEGLGGTASEIAEGALEHFRVMSGEGKDIEDLKL